MARLFLSLGFTLALMSGAALLRAADDTPTTAPATRPAASAAAPIVIGEHMNAMSKALQSLQAALKDPVQPDAALAALGEMERNAVIAKGGIPPYTGGLPAEQLPKFYADYRSTMIKLLRQMLDIEDNINAAKYKEANDGITELIKIEDEGHKKFTSPFSSH